MSSDSPYCAACSSGPVDAAGAPPKVCPHRQRTASTSDPGPQLDRDHESLSSSHHRHRTHPHEHSHQQQRQQHHHLEQRPSELSEQQFGSEVMLGEKAEGGTQRVASSCGASELSASHPTHPIGDVQSPDIDRVCLGRGLWVCPSTDEIRHPSQGHIPAQDLLYFHHNPVNPAFQPAVEWLLQSGAHHFKQRSHKGSPVVPDAAVSSFTSSAIATPLSPLLIRPHPQSHPDLSAKFISATFVAELCAAVEEVLATEPNVLSLSMRREGDALIVAGDLYGQFYDLYGSILSHQYRTELNPEQHDRHFLFLGNYVNHGSHSLEVLLLLFSLKVAYPQLIHLLRGSQEQEQASSSHGFLAELKTKLGEEAGLFAWKRFNSVFRRLPLAAVVDCPRYRFFAAHGGLSPTLDNEALHFVQKIQRGAYGGPTLSADEENTVEGLLCSDPLASTAPRPDSRARGRTRVVPTNEEFLQYSRNPRGRGFLFGHAASARFCNKHQFSFICRSNQVVMDGVWWQHRRHVLTIFSAPNFCGQQANRAAIMIAQASDPEPKFFQYTATDNAHREVGACSLSASMLSTSVGTALSSSTNPNPNSPSLKLLSKVSSHTSWLQKV